jgi:hypothetical protein
MVMIGCENVIPMIILQPRAEIRQLGSTHFTRAELVAGNSSLIENKNGMFQEKMSVRMIHLRH